MRKLILLLALAVISFLSDRASAQPLKASENLRHERVLLPSSTPDKTRLVLREEIMFMADDGIAGIVVYYDDKRTKREVDFIEFYDLEGDLLLVSWIDRSGVRQAAMDRGLLDPKNPTLDRVLFLITIGTAL